MHDQTQQILHDLTEAFMDIQMHAKISIITQIVYLILKFKKCCNLIGGEHFGLQPEKKSFSRLTFFIKSYSQLWGII